MTDRAPTRVVATWPKGSFAENLAVAQDGTVLVTLHTDQAVVRVDPSSGKVTPFATFPTPVAGLAFASDGSLIVSGGTPGQPGGAIWRATADGTVRLIVSLPEAAFLNGVAALPGAECFLVAESFLGIVYLIDVGRGVAEPWLVDARLAPPQKNGSPGANGIKLNQGFATISVTGADAIYRTPIADGRPGALGLVASHLRADDFAFGVDGSLFIATHPAHSLVRLAPDGTRTTLATAREGMTGATAVAFGRGAEDRTSVYVTTTGGARLLPVERLEPAKLVRVEVGVAGAAVSEPPA